MESMVPYLKKEAMVPIIIGTGFVQQLNTVINTLLADKTPEDVARAQTMVQEGKPLEPWMQSIQILQVLIKEVYDQAEKKDMVEYKPLEIMLRESLSSDQSLPPL